MNLFLAAGAAPEFFVEIAALIIAGALIAFVCQRIGILPIVGFLLAGVVIGPMGLALVRDQALVDAAAEVGVILLLFTIGIEFSLEKLARIQRLIFGGGGLQVLLVTGLTTGILVLCGVSWQAGVFTGFLVALSSTAIVLKVLNNGGEINSEHGQVGLGLLIFQDLAIIVMVMLVPFLGEGGSGSPLDIVLALGKAGVIIVLVLLVARRVMPRLLEAVARTCSPEIFLLTVIGICLGTAYLTSLADVSLSLGAFLAGLIVSESRFSEHAMSEIMPLQIIFSATFFVSVGMLLDLSFLLNNLPLVLACVLVVFLIKLLTTAVSVRLLGYAMPVVFASSMLLAQIGEFSFVLERVGREAGLFPAGMEGLGSQAFIAATVIMMVMTPFLRIAGARGAERLRRRSEDKMVESMHAEMESVEDGHGIDLSDHIIIAGYGNAARHLVRVLRNADVPYVITTLSPEGALEAEAEGLPVLRGDSTKNMTLQRAGAGAARLLVIADDKPETTAHIIGVARAMNPALRIVARTRYVSEVDHLHQAGAHCVIAEEHESIVQLFAELLRDYKVDEGMINAEVQRIRENNYAAVLKKENTVPAPAPRRHGARTRVDTESTIVVPAAAGDVSGCSHLTSEIRVIPRSDGCEECLRSGDSWVHLRVCLSCGHVGCCDDSPNRHASKHAQSSGHPLIRSAEPGETWVWCYEDKVMVE